MKKILIMIPILLSICFVFAQVSEYTFSQSTETYTEITGGTVVMTGNTDDSQYAITPPFDFTYNGVMVTAMAMSTNGYLSFNSGTTSYGYTAISSTTTGAGVVAPFSKDLRGNPNGEMRWEVFGTAPNRYAIYQWKNFQRYGTSYNSDSWNAQVILYEGSNNIAIRYGTFVWASTYNDPVQVGMRGATNAEFINRTTVDNWLATTAGTSNSATCAMSTTIYPTAGLQFLFSYPQAVNPPNAPVLLSPADGAWAFGDATLNWQSGGGLPDTYDVYFGTTNPPAMVSDNQMATSYTPTLAPGTTYYWYVTAANAFGDSPATDIWSFTTAGANQLAESFEPTTFPPVGWANGTSGSWTRSTSTPHFHGTGKAYKYTSTSTAYQLSTPMVTITENSELNFWTRAASTSQVLQVVYSEDRTTWTQVGADITYPATGIWYNQVIDLSSLAGRNYYLAFQTPIQTSASSIYVDYVFGPDITPLAPGAPTLTAPADLATNVNEYPSFSWTAPTTGGIPTGYDLYLDTVDGSTLYAEGVTSPYTLTTPLNYETMYYWTVVAENAAGSGDPATVRSFTTRANPTISSFPWTVDFGTVSGDWPVLNWSQLINQYGTTLVSGTRWYQDDFANVTTPLNKAAKMNIWSSNFGWLVTPPIAVPATGYELKFDIALTDYAGTVPPTPGEQADDKFIVLVDDNPNMTSPTILREWNNTGSSYVYDNVSNTGETHSIGLDDYVGTYYFAFYGESSVSGGDNDFFVDNVIVRETPAVPMFGYSPDAIDFGMVGYDTQVGPQNVTITNIGGGTLNIAASDLSLTGPNAAEFSFSTDNLPAALSAGESVLIPVFVTGVTEGLISATLSIVNNETRPIYEVALSADVMPEGLITIGSGTSNNSIPIHPFFGYTYSQSIFLQSEINVDNSQIESVYYYWNGYEDADSSNDWVVYMGHTANTEFTDWLPLSGLTQVFAGEVALPAVAGWIEIPLSTPFVYNNMDNLVIAVEENETGYDSSSAFFYSTTTPGNRTIRYYSDSTNPDPATPPTGTVVAAYPNLMLATGEVLAEGPEAVTLVNPANESTGLPIAGFNLSWTPAETGGTPTYYTVYIASSEDTIYDEFFFETTATTFNPVVDGELVFNYLDTWYWTVEAVNDYGSAVVIPPYWFEIEEEPMAIDTFPWTENFDSGLGAPTGWTVTDVDGAGTVWEVSTAQSHTSPNSIVHAYSTATPDPGQDGWLVTPPIAVPEGLNMVLGWWNYNVWPTYMVYNGVLVNTTPDPSDAGWVELWSADTAASAWSQSVVNISAYGGQTVYFAFNYQGYDGDDWYIDDVSVYELLVDEIPPTITHLPLINTMDAVNSYVVTADIADDATWNNPIFGANLYYSIDGGTTWSAPVPMTLRRENYSAEIPAQILGTVVSYYIEAWDSETNMATTATFAFEVNDPVWVWYDTGGTTWTWFGAAQPFSPIVLFENPLYGTGNALQLNTVDGLAYDVAAATSVNATLHVYTWDGVGGYADFVDLTGPIAVEFAHQAYETFDLSALNLQISTPFFLVSYDLPENAAFLYDNTYDYGTTYAIMDGVIYTMSNPGAWCIGANIQTGAALGLDTPMVNAELSGGLPTITWDAIDGASSYQVMGAATPDAEIWTLLATTANTSYTYDGTDAIKFFKVVADSEAAPLRHEINMNINARSIRSANGPKAIINNTRR